MFGISNRKQEREREFAECRAALTHAEQMLGEMSLVWVNAEQKLSEMEREQKKLERQLKQAAQAAGDVFGESERQEERNGRLLQQTEEIAGKQRLLKAEQQRVQEETGEQEAQEPLELSRIVAPITIELSHGMDEMRKMLGDVMELGRKMDVLSLNAAVEAGRMGEDGKKFVEAAEEIRETSKQYQQATSALAQQMQAVGLSWQKSKDEISEVEQRLKQQHAKLQNARRACEDVGSKMLNLPVGELQDEMERVFGDEALQERCKDVSGKLEEVQQDFAQQKEACAGLRQTVDEAKALIKKIQG